MFLPVPPIAKAHQQRPNEDRRRSTPAAAFLDFDPILPEWSASDCDERIDSDPASRELRQNNLAKYRATDLNHSLVEPRGTTSRIASKSWKRSSNNAAPEGNASGG